MKKLILFLIPALLYSCGTGVYNPTATPIIIDSTTVTLPPLTTTSLTHINTIWLKPSGENSNMQGVCLKIVDKQGTVVFSGLSVISQEDNMFHWYPDLILEPNDYTFATLSASGNIISQSTINIGSIYPQDEYILAPNGMVFYFQLEWL